MRHTNRLIHLVFTIVWVTALVGTSTGTTYIAHAAPAAAVRYVIAGGATSGTCTSWGTACELQYALSVAVSGDDIWVKAGTYKPTTGSNRSATFQLKSLVGIYGGFAMTETLRSQRNWTANVTILSGDIGVAENVSDNSYHVVKGASAGGGVLDGFTVMRGTANGADPDNKGGGMFNPSGANTLVANVIFDHNSAEQGGGMYNEHSSPELTNVTFSHNAASQGGGMFNYYGINAASNPSLTGVTFVGNVATGSGGGMVNSHCDPTLTNVTFSGNSVANGGGGGMLNTDDSDPTLTNVTFNGNSATSGNGGGMLNDQCSPALLNVTFANNTTTGGDGGAMYNDLVSSPALTNTTFYSNAAIMSSGYNGGHGGAVYNYATPNYTMTNVTFKDNRAVGYDAGHPGAGGAMWTSSGSATIINTIMWGNTPDQVTNDSSTTSLIGSLVQGGCPTGSTCTTVISSNPLLGALGNYGGNVQTIPLLPSSPAIDAALSHCPATDARGVTRPQGPLCDIGAFESSRFTLAITGGNNQSTPINTAFAQPLRVSVTANNAVEPVNGGKVTYTPPGSGASAGLAASPATIASGAASVNAAANGVRGGYTVTAGMIGGNTVTFNLRNTGVLYVKPGATGNCTSWPAACGLQTALGSAGMGDEIWVATGTYTPTTGTDPNATFALVSGAGMYGGFGGVTETARNQRNWTAHITTLSGKLSGGAHALHVATANTTVLATVLDGFTITGGQGTGQTGGGVYINNGSLTIANCDIISNSAVYGGGVFQSGAGRVNVINSIVERNQSSNQGGGLYINGDAALTDTLVLSNTSGSDGGGLTAWAGRTDLVGGMFAGNSAGGNGGGVNANNSISIRGTQFISNTTARDGGGVLQWNAGYTVTVTGARFLRNSATGQGGGVWAGGSVDAVNALFAGNQAAGSGAALRLSDARLRHVTIGHPTLGSGAAILMTGGTARITDTIIAGYATGINQSGGALYADYDLVFTTVPTQTSGGVMHWGSHNLTSNPQFVDRTAGDYHLAAESPAIDTGTNAGVTSDLDGIARPQGKGYDIGAYEARFAIYVPLVLRNAS